VQAFFLGAIAEFQGFAPRLRPAVAAVNTLASGQCGLADGSAAGQWRMPNRAELLSVSDLDLTWTSTTDAADTALA
jgi:hypothetical protein